MAAPKGQFNKESKAAFDLLEYVVFRVISLGLLILAGLGFLWHGIKLLLSHL